MELEYDRGTNLSLHTTLLYLVYLILFTYSDIVKCNPQDHQPKMHVIKQKMQGFDLCHIVA